MVKKALLLAVLSVLLLAVTGCGLRAPATPDAGQLATWVAGTLTAVATIEQGAPSTPSPATPVAVELVTPTPPGTPAAGQSPANPPVGVLPAPLYYLSDASGSSQVWRMETDGASVRQVTSEASPVTHFDISPVDGRLAYISGNDLYLAAPDGSGRSQLVDGPPMPAEDHPQQLNLVMGKPFWSPDGATIAYGLGGVNQVPAAGGQPRLVLASDAVPAPPNYAASGPVYFYNPNAWAPDGQRLLVDYGMWPEAGGVAVLPANLPVGGKPVMLSSPDGIVCCQPTWSVDGQSIYYASPYIGMVSAGLWKADPNTGSSTTLIKGDAGGNLFLLPGFPHQGRDGKLYYFFATANEIPVADTLLSLHRSEPDGVTGRAPLRSDAYRVNEALWAPDDRGVVIVDLTNLPNSAAPGQGPLRWLDVLGRPAVTLNANGHYLRWGK